MKVLIQYFDKFSCPTRAAFCLTLVMGFCSLSPPLLAQQKQHAILQTTQVETDSTQGYWRLKTLVDARMTVVQFFAPGQQLVYQETLPEKWVKPTRRNRRQFDRLLSELLAHQLLTTHIKTETLPALLPEPRPPLLGLRAAIDQNTPGEKTPYVVGAFVNKIGKLRLAIDSPLRLRYRIELRDRHGKIYYEERNNRAFYRRWLDISGLETGQYSLIVHINKQAVRYELDNGRARRVYQLEPLAVAQR